MTIGTNSGTKQLTRNACEQRWNIRKFFYEFCPYVTRTVVGSGPCAVVFAFAKTLFKSSFRRLKTKRRCGRRTASRGRWRNKQGVRARTWERRRLESRHVRGRRTRNGQPDQPTGPLTPERNADCTCHRFLQTSAPMWVSLQATLKMYSEVLHCIRKCIRKRFQEETQLTQARHHLTCEKHRH